MKNKLSLKLSRDLLLRAVVYVASVIIIYIALPKNDGVKYDYDAGKLWNYDALITDIDVPIFNDPQRQQEILDSLKVNFKPVYERTDGVAESVIADFRDRLAAESGNIHLTNQQRNLLFNTLRDIYKIGVIDIQASGVQPAAVRLHVAADSVSDPIPAASFYRFATVHSRMREAIGSDTMLRRALTLAPPNVLPNLVYDSVENKAQLEVYEKFAQAAAEVIHAGTKIVERGDFITPHTYTVLQSYEQAMSANADGNRSAARISGLGAVIIILVMMTSLFGYLRIYRPDYFADLRKLTFLSAVVTAFVLLAFALAGSFERGIFMVPYAMIPILILVFLDSRTAYFTYLVTLLLCAAMTHFMWDFIMLQFVAGFVALISIRELSKRSQLIQSAVLVFLAYSVVYTGAEFMQTGRFDSLEPAMFGAFGINALLISFAYILIFIVEKSFGFISRVTLVELSDINHPLLRELSEECPGTFQHSMAVSNIAASAASKLGANVQLVRAGALYHDIGKISNPAFFTENQHGINPHDALSPMQSARIVVGHVTDGIKRAEKAKLPARIRDFILQHHGAGTARYFYTTYCNLHPGEEVDPAPFQYPGPNPQSIEASILMMADAVEAASRSLKDHSPESIDALVNKIIDSQVREGLHNDSPISFRDITAIKRSFASTLRTMYHSRISYPEAIKKATDEPQPTQK